MQVEEGGLKVGFSRKIHLADQSGVLSLIILLLCCGHPPLGDIT